MTQQQYHFTPEILSMMHAFGDSSQPMAESAQLIESIVHDQMDALLEKAFDVGRIRDSAVIGAEDILFLLRKDKSKLARLINHLYVKDLKQSYNDGGSMEFKVLELHRTQTKRIKICIEYLTQLDEFGEYKKVFNQALFDEIKNQRMRRMDSMTRDMNSSEYSNFSKARQVSFINSIKPEKFSEWLLAKRPDIKISRFAFEMIQYLAHETVAQVVDLSILVKQDMEREPNDPLSVLISKSSHNRHERHGPTIRCNQQISKPVVTYSVIKYDIYPKCITPHHIREAMRRYCTPSGPFADYRLRNGCPSVRVLSL